MVKSYNFNLTKLIKRLTPPRWKTKFNLSWYETLLSQINFSKSRFNTYKDQTLIELSYNGQTIYLEKMLNDKFDPIDRRILVLHEEDAGVYFYNELEGQAPLYLYRESETGYTPTYLYKEGEDVTEFPDKDFIVKAPSSLTALEIQMNAQIRKYKLAGKEFEIIFS